MKNNGMVTAYIGVGSNLGDRQANIKHALAMLIETPQIEIRRISAMFDNPAVGGAEGSPNYLNAAVEIQTTLQPQALLARLLEIEQTMGRERNEKWGSRNIDLDLLLYGNAIVSKDNLIVPHPLMHERMFVLRPLAEIAPRAVHPTLNVTIQDLLGSLSSQPVRQ